MGSYPTFEPQDVEGNEARDAVQRYLLHAWAPGTNDGYRYLWRRFVRWCEDRQPPLNPLPATDETLAMYLTQLAENAETFSVLKNACAAIRQCHVLCQLRSPTDGIQTLLVKNAAKRQLTVRVKNVKAPWAREHLVPFCVEMCSPLSSAPMWITGLLAFTCFATFGRFDCLAKLQWRDVTFEPDQMFIFIAKRKNDQFRHGSQVVIPAVPEESACVVRLFNMWHSRSPENLPEDFVFLDFPLTAASDAFDAPVNFGMSIKYAKYRKALSRWMAPHVGAANATDFLRQFGTKSGRAGGATAARSAGVPLDALKAHGGWRSDVFQRYVVHDKESRQSVGLAILRAPSPSQPVPAPAANISKPAGPAEARSHLTVKRREENA